MSQLILAEPIQLMILTTILMNFQLPHSTSVQRTDRDYDELTGPVRVIRIEDERLPEERPKGSKPERQLEKIVTYDSTGRMKEQIEFGNYPAMCVRARRTYSYDESGKRTETILWGKGLTDSATDVLRESLRYQQRFVHDELGRRTQVDDYDASGKLHLETTCKYDEKSRVSTIGRASQRAFSNIMR